MPLPLSSQQGGFTARLRAKLSRKTTAPSSITASSSDAGSARPSNRSGNSCRSQSPARRWSQSSPVSPVSPAGIGGAAGAWGPHKAEEEADCEKSSRQMPRRPQTRVDENEQPQRTYNYGTTETDAAAAKLPDLAPSLPPPPPPPTMYSSSADGRLSASDADGNDQLSTAHKPDKLSSIDEDAALVSPGTDLADSPRRAAVVMPQSPAPLTITEPTDAAAISSPNQADTPSSNHPRGRDRDRDRDQPTISLQAATPTPKLAAAAQLSSTHGASPVFNPPRSFSPSILRPSSAAGPPALPEGQSSLSNRKVTLIRALLDDLDNPGVEQPSPTSLTSNTAAAAARKIWVKRAGASATMISIGEDDLVDDVREIILRKYMNSMGRQFDAPDLTLRIVPREPLRQERTLGPEEHMARTLDAYYPGGQTVDEALVIEVPLQRRTPKPSPRTGPPHMVPQTMYYDESRPMESGNDYFGPAALAHLPVPAATVPGNMHAHAISVLSTGQIPQLPSPGSGGPWRSYRDRPDRPKLGRQHTSSPTILNVMTVGHGGAGSAMVGHAQAGAHISHHRSSRQRAQSNASDGSAGTNGGAPAIPAPPPMPTPPLSDAMVGIPIQRVITPPPRTSSPRLSSSRPISKRKAKMGDHPSLPAGSLSGNMPLVGAVPPINVLIVEDNIINLKLLEAFVKRLKVRWQTAMNGRDAVVKWRTGGFHLVLMDIQLPVMSGLDATREIRRLERINSIGVFTSASSSAPSSTGQEIEEKDRLTNTDLFKSPVIIVALTASSLQSDRQDALAAGCNDFLTKPVNFVWLERKVMEWGCMQALIDFDGWRRWKDFTEKTAQAEAASAAKIESNKKAAAKAKSKKNRSSLSNMGASTASAAA